jgi:hypothetical protein
MQGNVIRLGIIGLGARSHTLLSALGRLQDLTITAVCDLDPAKIEDYAQRMSKYGMNTPDGYTDYRQMLKDPAIQGVLITTGWNSHLHIAIDVMRSGKYAGIEVGGAASIQELWDLVRAAESTGVSCMMLENCCYARNELMVLNMVRQGLFGELVYCECGYEHSLGFEMSGYYANNIERCTHNICRNGDLYPTHGLGPIAKILDINRGNRFLTISSHATKSRSYNLELQRYLGQNIHFNCGDIVTSVIHCANGENITITHGVSLPRPYSRNGRVQGTKGIWLEDANGIYVEGLSTCVKNIDDAGYPYLVHQWDPVESFYEKYDHPIWKKHESRILGGHGGIDGLTLSAFVEEIRLKCATPIDVYDCASWMAVTCLSEQSVALGGMPVPFPDFTDGCWINRQQGQKTQFDI